MGVDTLYACFENGKFHVAWKFQSNKYDLQSYDRIEVREKNEKEDITCAVQVTQSSLNSDRLLIRPVAPLNMADGLYYAVYISSTTEKEIARSDFFTASSVAVASFEENFLVDSEDDCIIDIIQVHQVITTPGKENCEVDIEWKFKDEIIDEAGDLLTKTDYICIIPVTKADDLKNVYHDHAFGLASGKPAGKVSIQLGGYVRVGYQYKVFYLLNHRVKGLICKGASDPFVIKDGMLPYTDNPATTKAASQQFNMSTVMQYVMQNQMETLKATAAYNPLLTITPKEDKWSKLIDDSLNKHKEVEDDALIHIDEAKMNDNSKGEEIDHYINESRMTKEITNAMRTKPCFLFAGAGISMAFPSSAPSWWKLMSDILEETLNAVPDELQHVAKKLRTTDSYRRPEDIMETYHFVLQNKLFDVFKLLNEGRPNANHRTIAKMAKKGKLRAILTTNFDEFIEQALDEERIAYKVVCTSEEYKEYHENGCEEFAVLKIHGTVSRPQTIIAVASHYKTSDGFEGYKSKVTHHFIKNFPTLFFGYSGWDFAHANYQEFWDGVGRVGGESIYFMKLKGSKGGPLLSKLVGRHVGDRLVIGEGTLPETAINIWERFDSDTAEKLMQFHHQASAMGSGQESIQAKQREYIKFWVHQIPKASLLAILWHESVYLNEGTNTRLEKTRKRRMKKDPTDSFSAAATDGVTAYLIDLSTKFAQGIITNEVYLDKQKKATIELSLAPLILSKRKKDKTIKLCAEACKRNKLLKGSHDYQMLLPSYILSVADAADESVTPIEYINEAIQYIAEVLEPLRKEKETGDEKSAILYELYHTQANLLRIPEQEREGIHSLFQNFADEAISKKWSEEERRNRTMEQITPVVTRIAFHQIDTQAIVASMVEYIMKLNENGSELEDIVEGAHVLALSLHKQAVYSVNDLFKLDGMQKVLQMFSIDVNKKIPDTQYEDVEKKLNETVEPLLNLLKEMKKRRNLNLYITPDEVLSTFDIANAEILRLFLKNSSTLVQDERRRESCGYYPRDSLPPSVATYLSRKVQKASKHIRDRRTKQSCLGLLCVLGESSNNLKQIQAAVDKSILLTEGKVTETTPYPIPEALAAQYQERGDFKSALYYYNLALDGIRTFVPRQKTDSIVLNACLVQAQFDVKEALKIAFEYSPFFSEVQQYSIVGPARSILVQQCLAWTNELGLTIDEALAMVMNTNEEDLGDNEDTEGISDSRDDFQDNSHPVQGTGTVSYQMRNRSKERVARPESDTTRGDRTIPFEKDIPKNNRVTKTQKDVPNVDRIIKSKRDAPREDRLIKSKNDIPRANRFMKSKEDIPRSYGSIKSEQDVTRTDRSIKFDQDVSKNDRYLDKSEQDISRVDKVIKAEKDVARSKSVAFEEPEGMKKTLGTEKKKRKRKKVKVRKEVVVQGLPIGGGGLGFQNTPSQLKTRKAIQGEKTCESCVIM